MIFFMILSFECKTLQNKGFDWDFAILMVRYGFFFFGQMFSINAICVAYNLLPLQILKHCVRSMISIQAKKHDNFSVEFKIGYNCKEHGDKDKFSVNSWIFVPNSLDINPENYGKKQFYRDIKSNVRLITPVYPLRDIAQYTSLPFVSLRKAIENVVSDPSKSSLNAYEYHLKMFAAIFKSALRDYVTTLASAPSLENVEYLVDDYVESIKKVLSKFRSLHQIIDVPTTSSHIRNCFSMSDEFMNHIVVLRTTRIVKALDASECPQRLSQIRQKFIGLILEVREYMTEMGYEKLTGAPEHDRQLLFHHGMLKKYVESELYIRLDKKKDGVAVEQLYYSIAAGVAMIFATGVAWQTQVRYGNITWPLFVVLVVSYMLKDRIKDLLRYYFAHKLGNKYFDKKATVAIGEKKIGVIKEGFDFISKAKTPEVVMNMREKASFVEDESHIFEEKILLYRKHVEISDSALAKVDVYPMKGINEIIRLHLDRFTHKMDDPELPIDTFDAEGNLATSSIQKIYYVNIVFQLQHDGVAEYHHFRITMTRNGIQEVIKIS